MTGTDITQQINEVQLVDVQVHSLTFQSRKDTVPLAEGAVPKWKLDYSVQYRLAAPTELHLKLRGQMGYADEETARPFDLAVEIVGIYHSTKPIEAEQIPSLLQTHSAPLLWPYLREVIADITTRAGGPSFVIPTLKITIPPRQSAKPSKKSRTGRSAGAVSDRPEESEAAPEEAASRS